MEGKRSIRYYKVSEDVSTLETKAMDARMKVVKAEEINETIDTAGRIAIYLVYFDTDKAGIKPESAESIVEMAKAVKEGGGAI